MNSFLRRLPLYISLILLMSVTFAAGYVTHMWVQVHTDSFFGARASATTSDEQTEMGVYWQAWRLLEQDFYGKMPDTSQRVYASIRGLVDSFNDPYTYFVEPQPRELERDQLRGSFGGIGVWLDWAEDGYRLRPMRGQPAEQAGVKANDLLLMINDTPITADMAQSAVMAMIRGPEGSQVCLKLRRTSAGDSLEPTFCMVRTHIETPSVEWYMMENDAHVPSIGYIKQTLFSERSPEEMHTAIQELQEQGADRFIWDLRGNPGGLVNAAIAVSDLWLDGGVVLIEEQADGREKEFAAHSGTITAGAPLVVLVDGTSASASEIVAGALQDHGRAVLVGERTFGKGSVQLVHELADHSSLHVTNARWYTPSHHAIDGIGITPDIKVSPGDDSLFQAVVVVQELAPNRQEAALPSQ